MLRQRLGGGFWRAHEVGGVLGKRRFGARDRQVVRHPVGASLVGILAGLTGREAKNAILQGTLVLLVLKTLAAYRAHAPEIGRRRGASAGPLPIEANEGIAGSYDGRSVGPYLACRV